MPPRLTPNERTRQTLRANGWHCVICGRVIKHRQKITRIGPEGYAHVKCVTIRAPRPLHVDMQAIYRWLEEDPF
jgi:hypothetical protein